MPDNNTVDDCFLWDDDVKVIESEIAAIQDFNTNNCTYIRLSREQLHQLLGGKVIAYAGWDGSVFLKLKGDA